MPFGLEKICLGMFGKLGNYVASRGKLFAVLETSWLNSQKDADGTVNMVNNTKDAVYKVGPQGQADMLSDFCDCNFIK